MDAKLSWGAHVERVTARALERLHIIRRGASLHWGLHPSILQRLILGVVYPTLFYASPVWCGVLRNSSLLARLDQVLRRGAVLTTGLLRTTSTLGALFVAGILPAEFHIRLSVVAFHARHLVSNFDLRANNGSLPIGHFASPRDILHLELRQLQRFGGLGPVPFAKMERRFFWQWAPERAPWQPTPLFRAKETAVEDIAQER